MLKNESGMIESVKNDVVTAIKATGNVVQAAMDTVADTLDTTVVGDAKTGDLVTGAAAQVAMGVIHGAVDVGAPVSHAAKGTLIGVLRASKHTGTEAINTLGFTTYVLIHGASEVGGELGRAAIGAVEGAISAAKEVGVSTEEAASAAAHGALQAADNIGSKALNTVRDAMKGTISGVDVVLKAPFRV